MRRRTACYGWEDRESSFLGRVDAVWGWISYHWPVFLGLFLALVVTMLLWDCTGATTSTVTETVLHKAYIPPATAVGTSTGFSTDGEMIHTSNSSRTREEYRIVTDRGSYKVHHGLWVCVSEGDRVSVTHSLSRSGLFRSAEVHSPCATFGSEFGDGY